MSRRDDKQVQEALEAIRKLVEVSEDKFEASSDVVMLDNVVWRNPSKDEVEEEIPLSDADNQPVSETISGEDASSPRSHIVPQSSASISARDLDEAKKQVKTPVTSPLKSDNAEDTLIAPALRSPLHRQAEEKLQEEEPSQPSGDLPEFAPQDEAPIAPLAFIPPIEDDITELTSPIGRKGGGFYSTPDMAKKPVIETRPLSLEIEKIEQKEPVKEESLARPVIVSEPAITDFHGADFTFSASEGLMTASTFDEAKAGLSQPIKPQVNVPVAAPAVPDPVAEVQAMYQPSQQDMTKTVTNEAESVFVDDGALSSGHPNLHIVSDQTASSPQVEEEGFSSAVRLALRSIIKEQVSTWLQGNMTELIEEALTNPQKRPSTTSKPSSKKR